MTREQAVVSTSVDAGAHVIHSGGCWWAVSAVLYTPEFLDWEADFHPGTVLNRVLIYVFNVCPMKSPLFFLLLLSQWSAFETQNL